MTVTVLGYLALLAAAIGLEIVARRPDSRVATIGDCLSYLMQRPAARVGVLAGWLWLGWHLFAR